MTKKRLLDQSIHKYAVGLQNSEAIIVHWCVPLFSHGLTFFTLYFNYILPPKPGLPCPFNYLIFESSRVANIVIHRTRHEHINLV